MPVTNASPECFSNDL